MSTTDIIAYVAGISMVIIGLSVLINPRLYRTLRNLPESQILGLFTIGLMTLVVGALVVVIHPVWSGRSLIVTLFGRIALIKGGWIILFPDSALQFSKNIAPVTTPYAGYVSIVWGVLLLLVPMLS